MFSSQVSARENAMGRPGKRGKFLFMVAVGALATLAGTSAAQESMPPRPPMNSSGKYQVKSLAFKLPFKIDPRTQANVQEMQLWSCDDKGVWLIMDRVSPAAGFFTCSDVQDGEYGFSIVTVDAMGKTQPGVVSRQPPDLLVVVQSGRDVAAPPMSPLVTEAPALAPARGPALAAAPAAPAAAPPPVSAPELPLAAEKQPAAAIKPECQTPIVPDLPQTAAHETTEVISETPLTITDLEHPPAAEASAPVGPAPVSTSTTILISSTQVSVDYNVNRKGPSGVSKVEIYGTVDGGRTWKRFGEDADRASPADVTLPGEGIFGLRLVGINGNGFGKPPATGAQPTTNIEVDLTRPKIQSWSVAPIKDGKLEIRWLVLDKNLGNCPVNLSYAHDRGGPWKPLCKKLKGEGAYQAAVPADAGDQIAIRIEAMDLAGNVARSESQEPLIVDRMEPEINVVGVTVTPRSAGERVVPASR
jgi:hypothetical protein